MMSEDFDDCICLLKLMYFEKVDVTYLLEKPI